MVYTSFLGAAPDATFTFARHHYHTELEQAYASRASLGAPEWEVTGWVTSYAAIATGEWPSQQDDADVE